ncbi:MAG: hypothetical protein JWN79_2102 [Gemmatimonadetes bacterium]|jgi:acetyltransferase|nr:hypothetical protein [Gemmatimonadota bacterium]
MQIRPLSAADIDARLPELVAMLVELVASGASIGFHPPMPTADAERFWRGVRAGVQAGDRIVLAALDADDTMLGTGQLALESRANGRHRGEVQKLMVLPSARRQGAGRALMLALQAAAQQAERTLLTLDTREGDVSARLYESLGWQLVGPVPEYVGEVDGTFSATLIFYLRLPGGRAG